MQLANEADRSTLATILFIFENATVTVKIYVQVIPDTPYPEVLGEARTFSQEETFASTILEVPKLVPVYRSISRLQCFMSYDGNLHFNENQENYLFVSQQIRRQYCSLVKLEDRAFA